MASSVTSEFCFILNGKGGGVRVSSRHLEKVKNKVAWVHLDEEDEKSVDWLYHQSGLEETVVENLLDEDTQPRYFTTPQGLFVVLRGVNANRNADVEDMIALRIWIEKDRIISFSHRRLTAIEKMAAALKEGKGPLNPMNAFIMISEVMNENISDVVAKIDDDLDDIEDDMIDVSRDSTTLLQSRISEMRHKILGIRRYLGPQRDLFNALKIMDIQTITKEERTTLKDISRDLQKFVEDLDFAREHSTVNQEELNSRINVQLNQTMYMLTIIMVVLAPLTLVTGILGSNSIEVSQEPLRFLGITGALAVFGLLQIWYLKKKKWF